MCRHLHDLSMFLVHLLCHENLDLSFAIPVMTFDYLSCHVRHLLVVQFISHVHLLYDFFCMGPSRNLLILCQQTHLLFNIVIQFVARLLGQPQSSIIVSCCVTVISLLSDYYTSLHYKAWPCLQWISWTLTTVGCFSAYWSYYDTTMCCIILPIDLPLPVTSYHLICFLCFLSC